MSRRRMVTQAWSSKRSTKASAEGSSESGMSCLRLSTRRASPDEGDDSLLVMERFLTRMVAVAPDAFVLKGGLALELRLARARTTTRRARR